MLIANPIYDVVFKFLMEDSKMAKLLVGAIIDQEIIELDFRPKSFTAKVLPKDGATEPIFTVYHLDFSAKIKTPDGDKLAVIEVQKAKLPSDIIRFRRYLGQQYSNKENQYWVTGKEGQAERRALPIISIYFLGHNLENIHGIPVIHVNRKYIDLYSKAEISQKDQFIESLTHDSYIISIEDLKARRRSELEILLSVFDQSNQTENHHILNVHEEDFPVKFRPIISRLQQAVEVQEIRDNMDMEDTILEEFEILERRAMDAERKIEEADRQVAAASQQVAAANQQAAALLQGNIAAARMMKASGLNEEDICRFLQINAEKLQEWLTLDEQ
jgi:hypothetical protein